MSNFFDTFQTSFVEFGEFLLAVGSVVGLLGLIIGLILFVWGGPRSRTGTIRLLIISFILLAVCGLSTGVKYFRIFH